MSEELRVDDQKNDPRITEKGNPTSLNPRKRSMVWDHFTKNNDPKYPRAICNYCGVSYALQHKRSGTSNMENHLEVKCKKYPERLSKMKQKVLSFTKEENNEEGTPIVKCSLKNHVYNYDLCRRAVVEMIICDELPFKFVEGKGFMKLCQTLEPRFTVPSRTSIATDSMKLYEEEKVKLKLLLKSQRVCLTTDTWTSIQNINYMCVTVHWIDENWKLNKRIINLLQVPNHRGETIGKSIESCMLSWGIDKILTLTVDNASSNDLAIAHIKRVSKRWPQTILENQHLHVRCRAHVLNLVVQDGLKEIDESVVRIRNAVRFVRSSPSRLLAFKECCEKEKIVTKSNLCFDVETRWNSTYLMLDTAQKFEKAFERLDEDEPKYISYFDLKKKSWTSY